MLTVEQNERLTRVGPGTPMGDVLRRYWHPIAAASQMNDRDTLPITLLGEQLVLYRDLAGTYGLLEPHCAHRSMSLVYGIPESTGLRCPYHGWLYDETGQCIEQPYEETEEARVSRPDSPSGSSEGVIRRFKDKVRMQAYPVQVMGGMIFAYLGPAPIPLLPEWDLFVMEEAVREVGHAVVPCNWLQIMENSLDPVHVEWLHQYFRNFVIRKLGQDKRERPAQKHVKLGFDEFAYGIIKRRVMEGGSEEDEEWSTGHPVVFPNILKSGSTSNPVFQIRVPVDDDHTAYWWYRVYTPESGVPMKPQAASDIPYYEAPVPQLDEHGMPRWDVLDNNSGQDIVAWITQGYITNRTRETLGRSDKGVILYRQQLEQALRVVEDGGDPMNVFRSPTGQIDLPVERNKFGIAGDVLSGQRSGNTTKYSPILKELDAARS